MKYKKVIAFDLDGTLADSKQPISELIIEWLVKISKTHNIAIISGCSWKQMQKQVLSYLESSTPQKCSFFFMPTCGNQMYDWGKEKFIYQDMLSFKEKVSIYNTWKHACDVTKVYPIKKPYGEIAEDRQSQITFGMCGQNAPLHIKEKWLKDNEEKRKKLAWWMQQELDKYNFSAKIGGTSSIDVTRTNKDKAYGMEQLIKYLDITKEDVLYFGDRLEEGGNDYPIKKMGIDCIAVKNYTDIMKKCQNYLTL